VEVVPGPPFVYRLRRMRRTLLPVLLFGLLACGDDDAASAEGGEAREVPQPGGGPEPEVPAEEGTPRVRLDLASHLDRAEIREGRTLVMDHGVPGGAKYTLGGWQMRTGPHHELDGRAVLLIPGTVGKVLLPVERGGPHVLALRARAFGDGRLTVYVDEETVHHADLPVDGSFGTVRIELSEDELPAGERFLQLRVPRAGPCPGFASAGVAVDWIRLAPEGEPVAEDPPPSSGALVGDGPSLRVPEGVTLGWALDVPEGARLRAARGGTGTLVVRAHRDGAAPTELGRLGDGASLDVDLDRLSGEVARIDLEARGGDVALDRPRVVTFDGVEALPEVRRPRNVVVYLIDTLRADKLEVYAPDTRVRTPGMSRFRRGATLFLRGQSQENWTKPSVATLLSGLLPWVHTANEGESVLPASVRTLSELLGDAGFHTGAFVANGYVSGKFGFRQGWSTWRNYIREGRRTHARFVASDVLEWLDERPEDRPFFLYVHTIDPHVPYIPPDDLLETYDPDPYDGPVDFTRDRELLEKIKVGSLTLDARDRRRLEALYDGEITYHDVHMAAILDGLERRGLADDTMVVITADHGEELFDHGSVGHGHSVWQELLHVPLLVRIPGLTDGRRPVPDAVGLVDVMPTVLDVLGRPIPEDVDGRSLLPLLRGAGSPAPRVSVSGFMYGWRTALVGRYKLVQRTESRAMLFDLEADPGEEDDLSERRPLVLRHVRGLLGLALAGEGHAHRPESTEIDPETEAQLRALGYVGASRP